MRSFENQRFRTLFRTSKTTRIVGLGGQHEVHLKTLDSWAREVRALQKEARTDSERMFGEQLAVAQLGVLALGFLATGTCSKDFSGPFPKDWLSETGRPNPNAILSLLLVQIANNSLAMVRLIEDGLEAPARALLRTILDGLKTLVVLAGDKECFETYAASKDPDEDRKVWHQIFARGQLDRRYNECTKKIYPDEKAQINETHRYIVKGIPSAAVHLSKGHTVFNVMAVDEKGNEKEALAIFGASTGTSTTTLDTFLGGLTDAFAVFPRVLTEIHGFDPESFPEEFRWPIALGEHMHFVDLARDSKYVPQR